MTYRRYLRFSIGHFNDSQRTTSIMKPYLPSVTLIITDCVDYVRARESFDHNLSVCSFGDAKLLTHLDVDDERVVRIPKLDSIEAYSRFMLRDLSAYFDTEHVLVAQWDGFIWNENLWDDEFLNYDYIGAPWPSGLLSRGVPKGFNVGNGGFSLRSKRLQEFLRTDEYLLWHKNEDVVISQINRAYLEAMGFTFAPLELAKRFSWENLKMEPAFGVHARIHGRKKSVSL